ncbi:MAG: toll/interleukin-1 receptor domain-containing protein, partial [Paludibacteraceae bacterium]|nr:toll/interleukin-1 receptor domain-containing protein [Paludibacteraceae bacterium]
MAKIFFSHSSKQKYIVNAVVDKYIGRDFSVVDSFAFDAGSELTQEIKHSISTSEIFVLFISDEALNSTWVNEEINYVRDFVDEKKIEFCPFIVDKNIDIDDKRIKPWIKNYLLKIYVSPGLIAHLIKSRYNRRLYLGDNMNPYVAKLRVFEGRDSELQMLGQKYFANIDTQRRAVFVSGMPHIGRKRLLKEAIVRKFFPKYDETYEPIIVSMTESDSIDIFVSQISEYLADESINTLTNRLIDKPEQSINICVEALNKLAEQNIKVIIDDNASIV